MRSLLISLSNIGDAVMTTPVLQGMHAAFPDDRIDIVADRRSAEIFENCPYRGEIYLKDKRGPLRGTWSLLSTLRRHAYRVAVDLRTDFLPFLLHAERRLPKWRTRPAGPHAVQQHLGVIAALINGRHLPGTCIWLSAGDREQARQLLGEFHGRRLLALGPGANWAPKIWPAVRFLSLANRLAGDFDALVLLGSAADRAQAARVAAGSSLPCLELTGRTTLRTAAAVLEEATLFVGNDSGLGHLASAVAIPSLTLFGVGDADRYMPWGEKAATVVEPGANLERLEVDTVLAALRRHLSHCEGR